MILFTFSVDTKTALHVYPDHCQVCQTYVPVTHIPGLSKATGKAWVDKICARCAVEYLTDDAFALFEADATAHVEFDGNEMDL